MVNVRVGRVEGGRRVGYLFIPLLYVEVVLDGLRVKCACTSPTHDDDDDDDDGDEVLTRGRK